MKLYDKFGSASWKITTHFLIYSYIYIYIYWYESISICLGWGSQVSNAQNFAFSTSFLVLASQYCSILQDLCTKIIFASKMNSPKKNERRGEERKSIANIFRYADWNDILLMLLGTVGAIGDGMSTNCLLVFASRIMNSLGYGQTRQDNYNFMVEVQKVSDLPVNISFLYLSC